MKISKKALALVLSLVLVAGCVVGGAVAWLTKKTGPVTNTFTAANLVDPTDKDAAFILKEHKANRDTNNGKYTLDNNQIVEANTYTVVPGVPLPKDPFVSVKTEENTYLFVEVVNNLPTPGMNFEMANEWKPLDGVAVGPNGGKIYVWNNAPLPAGDYSVKTGKPFSIIANNEITVDQDLVVDTALDADKTLNFYGYLTQATGFETAEAAWNAAKFAA